MNRARFALAVAAASFAAAGFASSSAYAKPANAAQTGSGSNCLVADANGVYHTDLTCTWHTVEKRNKDGELEMYMYQDQGQLPEGAPAPSTAQRRDVSFGNQECNEVTTPSGQYSSRCTIRP